MRDLETLAALNLQPYVQDAVRLIDDQLGPDYARKNPALLGAVLQALLDKRQPVSGPA